MVYENRSKLLKMLTNLKERNKLLTNQFFKNDQWIQYNPTKGYYEYEDGVFLGNTPEDVVEFFENLEKSEFGNWLQTAEWIEI